MPEKTYLLRFVRRDGGIEITEHVHKDWAKYQYELLTDPYDAYDCTIYAEIQLIERDWRKNEDECDTILEKKVFA